MLRVNPVNAMQNDAPRFGQTRPFEPMYINLRIVEITAGSLLSFEINKEGVFLFINPLELALIWPWVKL
uniref:hypothetical protein n=1 Tax=Pseudomonadati TaxID=3379134 RepID=UPI0015EE3FF5|nr:MULTISPECIES: hypothetical protein [Bacteria]